MKSFFYGLYAVMFNIFRIFPMNKIKVTFLSPHNGGFRDSLGEVMEEVIRRDEFIVKAVDCGVLRQTDRRSLSAIFSRIGELIAFFTVNAFHLATSKYVFLNDNFMPMAKLNFRKEAVITQLWHAEGAFKKFGLDIDQPEEIRKLELEGCKKLSCVVCSSESVVGIYAGAFGISEYKVLPLGSARSDYFFRSLNEEKLRARFDKRYPDCRGKKLVLYAPTFRDDPADDEKLLESFDTRAFNERFGGEYALLIRLHPQVHTDPGRLEGAVNVSGYENVNELVRLTDVLITDYSSICMDFALTEKPIYFYAFDFDKYNAERSFYDEYEKYIPGPLTDDFTTLLNLISSGLSETYRNRMYKFRTYNFGSPDGHAAERIVDRIIYGAAEEAGIKE